MAVEGSGIPPRGLFKKTNEKVNQNEQQQAFEKEMEKRIRG